jgi:hypothetical protein
MACSSVGFRWTLLDQRHEPDIYEAETRTVEEVRSTFKSHLGLSSAFQHFGEITVPLYLSRCVEYITPISALPFLALP